MSLYIIRFFEINEEIKPHSIAISSGEINIDNINDEKEIEKSIQDSFKSAIEILNNRIKNVRFEISLGENLVIFGRGIVYNEKIKIEEIKFQNKKR